METVVVNVTKEHKEEIKTRAEAEGKTISRLLREGLEIDNSEYGDWSRSDLIDRGVEYWNKEGHLPSINRIREDLPFSSTTLYNKFNSLDDYHRAIVSAIQEETDDA